MGYSRTDYYESIIQRHIRTTRIAATKNLNSLQLL
jgi:hypothetical protein